MFLQNKCDGQFHWGKNYRMEALKLREMFARAKARQDQAENSMVRKIRIILR